MKTKLCVLIFLLAAALAQAQTNDLTALLQQGLFEEQANQNLNAAIADYQSLATQFDKDRQVVATAVFRIGECYRMQGKTNEAALQYQRILRDFPDQTTLATLSRQDLVGMGLAESVANTNRSPMQRLERARQSELTGLDLSTDEDQEIQRIQTMIQNSPDLINAPDGSGHTPLENAAINSWLKVAAFLLDHGADVNARGGAALFDATGAGNRAMVEFLLAHGADVNAINNSAKQTPLEDAVQHGFEAVTEVLLANKAEVNAQDFQGNTPLFIAAQLGQTNIVQMLLTAGADVTVENNEGRTPLSFAAESGSPETVKAFLAAKTDPNAGTHDAPLLCAIDKNNLGCAELLLQADANPNVDGLMHCPQSSYGSRWYPEYSAILRSATPLWLAIQKHQLPMVQLLLKYKANPDVAQISEPPAVIFWALSNTNILQALLDAGANPNIKNNDGRTPLSVAAENGSLEAVKLLLAAKVDPNGGKLDAPLLCAINKKDTASAELLLQAGANPNAKGLINFNTGFNSVTPLWLAVSSKQLPMVQLLLKFKADPNDSQTDGRSLLFGALSDTNILEALLNTGAKADVPDETDIINNQVIKRTLLDAVAGQNNSVAVELLLKHGANPNIPDARGDTPLHWAALALADAQVFSLLLDDKANPNARDHDGNTPLDLVKRALQNNYWSNRFGNPFGQSVPPEQKELAERLIALLRQHGALDILPDWDRITVSRPSAHYSAAMFYKGTNDWNQFTLFDLLGVQYDLLTASPSGARRVRNVPYSYSANNNLLSFPDLTRIVIHRPSATGTNWNELKINLARALNSGDCSGDVPLRYGDVVEIPEADHVLNESWTGLSTNELFTLKNCLTRHLQITVNGQTTNIIVMPQVWELIPGSREYPLSSLGAKMPPAGGLLTAEPFMLWPVLENSKLLLASSDLLRVVVKRRDAATGKMHEWTVDCSNPGQPPNFWLRDDDVIEVPEKP